MSKQREMDADVNAQEMARAKEIQMFNQQMALKKKQDRALELQARGQAVEACHYREPVQMDQESSDKAATRQKIDADAQEHQAKLAQDKASKMVAAQNLKAALEAQMRERQARRALEKQERLGVPAHS